MDIRLTITVFFILCLELCSNPVCYGQNSSTVKKDSLLNAQKFYRTNADRYYFTDYDKSIANELKFLEISRLLQQKDSIAESFYRISVNQFYKGQHEVALRYTDSSLYFYNLIKDTTHLANTHQLRSSIYILLPDYEKSLIELNAAKNLLENFSDTSKQEICYLYFNYGIYYLMRDHNEKAITEFKRVLKIAREINHEEYIQGAMSNMAFALRNNGNIDQSISVSNEYLNYKWKNKVFNKEGMAAMHRNLAHCYLAKDRLDKALGYVKKAEDYFLANTQNRINIPEIYSIYGAIYLKKGDLKTSRNYFNKAYNVSKEVGNITLMIASLEGLMDIYRDKDHKKALTYLEEIGNLKDSILNVESLSRIENIEVNRAVAEKEKMIEEVKNESTISISNTKKRYSNYIYLILFVLVTVTSVFLFFYQKNRIAISENKRRLAESKLYGLRSQMNPHYIFNMLNSVQDFVLSSDKFAAYNYLGKFSKSVRLILDNADSSVATIHSELEVIQLYVELQQIRFPDKIRYKQEILLTDHDKNLKIPSMLLQPIIENAIVHGILNKKKGGKVVLQLELNDKKDTLKCTVVDNGIGRWKASRLNTNTKARKKSITEHNIKERIAILKKIFTKDFSYEIIDLVGENEKPKGTKVCLKLPIVDQYT